MTIERGGGKSSELRFKDGFCSETSIFKSREIDLNGSKADFESERMRECGMGLRD